MNNLIYPAEVGGAKGVEVCVAFIKSVWNDTSNVISSWITMGLGFNINALPAGSYGIYGHTANNGLSWTINCIIGGVNHYYQLYTYQATVLQFTSGGGALSATNIGNAEGAYTLFLYT